MPRQAVRARVLNFQRKYQESLQPSGSATEAEILYRLLSSNAQLATHLAASISISAFL
jgi:hypothetical protein